MPNYYLGIDVSKSYAYFIILDESKQSLEEGFQLYDTYGGHLKLFEYLQDFLSCCSQSTFYAGVESTGGYENNWYNHLVSIGRLPPIHVTRLNPFRVKSNSEAGLNITRRIRSVRVILQKKFLEGNYQEAQEQVDLLTTFKGIGVYSAVGLLLNIVSVERFPGVKKLSAYFGVHSVYKQSGDGIGSFHMSKQGRSEPRAILYMVALSAIQYNPVIKELYGRCLHKGMNRS